MNKTDPNKSKFSEVTIANIGIQGDGIANGAGERYYVPYAAPGDRLIITQGEQRKDGRFAKIENVVTPGPDRIDPVCAHFGTCGGCSLQHLSNDAIAAAKRGFIVTAMGRRGFESIDVANTFVIDAGERRRVRLSVHKGRASIIGFKAARSRHVVDIRECPAIRPAIAALIDPLRALSGTLDAIGRKASILVTETDNGIDLLLRSDVFADLTLTDRETLAQFADHHDLARIAWDARGGAEPVAERRQPRLSFGDAAVRPPPGAFLQPSAAGEKAIVRTVVSTLSDAKRIADLYAGCGTLTFPLSRLAPTHAFEGDAEMIAAIRRAAAGHPVTATERDLARMPLTPRELETFDTVVFDPPRSGAKAQAAQLAASKVVNIVAVSCNPATLARDLRILADGGYTVESVLPIDQFPWSPHVEAVAILRRQPL
ncbi:MAG: class I SAM-dependent RNA methyltransferase [Alphaproteobacteria bacterium]|nr:class I SAM-dependent RNA methyltransferase [Alphaproteobacteria bacterium]